MRFAVLLLVPLLVSAQNLAEFEKRVTEFTLTNGMRFIVLERHQAPVVSFNMFVNAGDVDDPAGQSNMAHMFEHMIGKGTRAVGTTDYAKEQALLTEIEALYDKVQAARGANAAEAKQLEAELQKKIESANVLVEPNAFPRVIEESGGVGFNAGTSQDYTTYFYSLPSNRAELWFLLQSEWLRRPVFREFYKERDVVRQERRMRVESNPQGRLMTLLVATSFMVHPYRNFMGWPEEIESLRARDAEAFFRRFYVPRNIVVSIVGDIDSKRARELAEKYYGSIPSGPLPDRVTVAEPPQDGEKRAELHSPTQPLLMMAYRRPDTFHKDDAVFDVINGILSSGRTGWFYQDLVRDKRVALGAGAYGSLPGGKYPHLLVFVAAPSVGHTVEENLKAIDALIEKLKTSPVDAETLQRVKTKTRAGFIRQLDTNQGLSMQLAYAATFYGDWRKMFTQIEEVEKVSAEDVQRVAREYLVPRGRTIAYTVKTEAAK